MGKHRPSVVKKGMAGVGQLHPSRLASKQLGTDLLFNGLDLSAERRLLRAKSVCRPGDVPFFRDRDEYSEVSQLHNHIASSMYSDLSISWFACCIHATRSMLLDPRDNNDRAEAASSCNLRVPDLCTSPRVSQHSRLFR